MLDPNSVIKKIAQASILSSFLMEQPPDAPQERVNKSGQSWPLWKKLALLGLALLIVAIALGVGLGVGLTRNNNHSDNNSNSTGNGAGNGASNGSSNDTNLSTWQPHVNSTWQIILSRTLPPFNNTIEPNVDIWDLDLFDNLNTTFKQIHDAGKKVICYFSAGSYENFRPDKARFMESDLGKPLDGWPDERWLKLDSENVRNIMKDRIKLASTKGCDALDPDNVDGYQNDNGLNLTPQDSIDYIKFLHDEAQSYNMTIGLKNAGDIISDVLPLVGFSVNEQCVQFKECETFAPFIKAGKPVFHIEYPDGAPKIDAQRAKDLCSHEGDGAGSDGFSTVLKTMDLDGFVQYCDGRNYQTPTRNCVFCS